MLHYLNGIGAIRRAKPKRTAGKFKGALKFVSDKMPQKQVIKRIKLMQAKSSPLTAMRIRKGIVQSLQRQRMLDAGEPLVMEQPSVYKKPFYESFETDSENVNLPENEVSYESESDDDGMFYPDEMGGFYKEKRKIKLEKKKAKVEVTKSKASKRSSTGKARELKAEGRRLKGERGSGAGKEYLDKGLDLASKFLTRKDAGELPPPSDTPKDESWFEKNKMLVIGGGAALVLGAFLLSRKK